MRISVPGDKSISQRGLILAALAEGESRLRGLVPGGDPASTAEALRALGVRIPPHSEWEGEVRIQGLGLRGLQAPSGPLDLQNSGTGARLLLGVLSGQPLKAVVTGDDSLRRRPMGRVTGPLSAMGARFRALEADGRLPILVEGGELEGITYRLPVASAQVKSSILLAGLVGGVPVSLREPGRSRDHTERILDSLGVCIASGASGDEWVVEMPHPPDVLPPLDLEIPGDFSSAAFFLLLGLLRGGTEPLILERVGLNPTRTGLLPVLERMGGNIRVESPRGEGQGEPLGNLVVRPSRLAGTVVGPEEIPGLIDEVPILVAGAVRARGETRIFGARELRVKETDRIHAMVTNLRRLGVEVEELEDGMVVRGTEAPLTGAVRSFGDHRIAMAFGVLGALPGNHIVVEGRETASVSFPGFWETLGEVGKAEAAGREEGSRIRAPVITLDGPAGSGKSTTAQAVARRLGFRHLDSGALYRALTYALMNSGIPEERWTELSTQELDRFPIRLEASGDRLLVMLGDRVLEGELRTPEVTARVSPLSALPAVRKWLLEAQRRAGRTGGLVADGRDMGTVVFPQADLKVFLTARLEERARRRFLEREGREPDEAEVAQEADTIRERDARDAGRAIAPLKRPEGALEVDTSELTFEDQVALIVDHAKKLD